MINRAYSLLEVKTITEESGYYVVRGTATTPTPDRLNDVVEPLGATFAPEIPLLWQHQADKPVGTAAFGKATKNGIPFTAKLPVIRESGALKDRIDEAVQSIKYRLVAAVSIGFRVLNDAFERLKDGGIRYLETEIMELSLVTIPAQAEATIRTVKSIDQQLLAASGHEQKPKDVADKSPGASGKSVKSIPKPKETKMNVKEQIASFEAKRAASVARMEAIMEKATEEGRTLDEAETEEYDGLQVEVESVDKHLKRLKDMERVTAKPVVGKKTELEERATGPAIIINREPEEKFKGQKFTRIVIAKGLAALDDKSPTAVARERGWDKTDPTLFAVIQKANEVTAGGEQSGQWGAELAQSDTRYTGDFIEFLYSRTVFDKLPLRQVPANVHIKGQDGAATGYWVGEKKAIPVSKLDFSDVELRNLKAAALAVISNELLRDSSPSAEQLVRDGLVEASAQRVDQTFLSAAAAVSGVSPAGILNGLSAIPATGWDADALRADVKSLYAPFIAAKNASGLYFVMNTSLGKALQLMVNALGQSSFPGITAAGGTLLGDPVVTGDNVPALDLILLKPSDIYRIGDTGVQVSVSRDATIEMSSAPAGDAHTPTGGTENPVSMFQTESTAFKVVRALNFAKRRSSAVQYIADAEYGTETSST